MSAVVGKDSLLTIGASPRAALLPPEIKADEKVRAARRLLVLVLVAVVAVVGLAYVFASATVVARQDQLASELARTDSLVLETGKYVEVSRLEDQLIAATAARQIGTSTEIDWQSYLRTIVAQLPAGTTLESVTVTTATPVTPFAQSAVRLQPARVAELAFTLRSAALPDTAQLLENVTQLTGYTDASIGSVTASTGAVPDFAVAMILHIDERAYWNRFPAESEQEEAAE